MFAKATLGNIGYMSSFSCQSTNIAELQTSIDLKCPRGTFEKMVSVGLSKTDD